MSVLYIRDESGVFKAITTIAGEKGEKGEKGESFTYDDFTPEQLESLRGPAGVAGPAGPVGPAGPKGEPGTPVVDEVLPDGIDAVSGAAVATYVDIRVAQLGLYVLITGQPVPMTVNKGETATFTVSAVGKGLTYQWQYSTNNGEGWTDSGKDGNKEATLWFVTDHHNGYLYRCVITDANGNKAITEPVMLTVIIQLKITKQPEDMTVAVNTNAIFTVEAEGVDLTYQWQYRTNPNGSWWDYPSTGTKKTLTVYANDYKDGYSYRCNITDASGNTVTSDVVTLTVVPILITKQPEDVTAVVKDWATFKVEAAGEGLTYQWKLQTKTGTTWSNSGATGATTNEVKFEVQSHQDGFKYRCEITDANGNTVTSDVATLHIRANIITQPKSQAAVAGDTVTFSVEATGVASYQWQIYNDGSGTWSDLTWEGAKTATMTRTLNVNTVTYKYRCKLTGMDGTVVYTDVVHFAPIIITKQPENANGSIGDTVTFSIGATGYISMYRWQRSTDGGTTFSPVYWGNSGFDTDTFTFAITDDGRLNGLYRCVVYCSEGDEYNVISDVVSITSA